MKILIDLLLRYIKIFSLCVVNTFSKKSLFRYFIFYFILLKYLFREIFKCKLYTQSKESIIQTFFGIIKR